MITHLTNIFESDIPEESDPNQIECGIWLSYYEIYNEKIYDLLQTDHPQRTIQTNKHGQMYISRLRQVYVTNVVEAYQVFLYGQHQLKQHISKTCLNDRSSRSHSSFNITLVRVDPVGDNALISNISFCDLAGAERNKKTNATGARCAEAIKINNSLSFLSNCLLNLKSQQKYFIYLFIYLF